MISLLTYCTDLKTLKICEKYSNEGFELQNGDEYIGDLNFKGRQDFENFLNDIGESFESLQDWDRYPFSKFPDLEFAIEDDFWNYVEEMVN